LFFFVLAWGALCGGVVGGVYAMWAAQFDMAVVEQIPERSTVFDRDGKPYGRLTGENRLVVPLEKVSPFFVRALLAREDSRFYSHAGVDPFGIARALVRNLVSGSAAQGASTLTQQLARNSFPLGGKNLHRKVLEAFVAFRIEKHFSKNEILEHYMNRIYFGAGVFGIETASQVYFNKHASELTLGEAAMIAGIIRGPSRFSPLSNLKGALRERDTVLDRLEKIGECRPAEIAAARAEKPAINPKPRLTVQENYVMDAVIRELGKVLSDDELGESGLRIYTTVDSQLQEAAQQGLNAHLSKIESKPGYAHPRKADFTREAREAEVEPNYLQGAVVVLDNRTAGIRALVGGREYADSRYNRALLSERPIGSTFKSFIYLAAFGKGLSPSAQISDAPLQRGEIKGAGNWSPGNSDGTFKGMLPVEEGLIQSRNTATVRVGDYAGLSEISKVASVVGLEKMPMRPSAYLGAFESNLLRVTNAYTVFPNGGRLRKPHLIERVENAAGTAIYRAPSTSKAVLHPGACALVTSALTKVLERGTAAAARSGGFKKPAAGKTGTTDDYKDAWFIGFTSSLTAGVWVGFDKPQRTVAQGYGATMALPVWLEVLSVAPENRYPALPFRETGGGGMIVPVVSESRGSPAAASPRNPPQVVPVQAPPRVEAVPPEGQPPRVTPVLKPVNP
jgi:penicillin-binding protein 1A